MFRIVKTIALTSMRSPVSNVYYHCDTPIPSERHVAASCIFQLFYYGALHFKVS
jgi:hypothetical protein